MQHPSPTILIVDDEGLIRWSLGQHFTHHGYRVVEAATDCGARLALQDGAGPDLVLLDLRLPDSDGLSLLDHIRRTRPDCRVIVLSAQAAPDTVCAALELGASAVTHKPFELEFVQALVERALAGGAHRSGTRDSA